MSASSFLDTDTGAAGAGLEPKRHLRWDRFVDYREQPPPPGLGGLIKTFWTLCGTGGADRWLTQQATPDGCVELIRRFGGASRWGSDQPESFVVGLIQAPTGFSIRTDSRFAGIRLWPWAWSLLDDRPLKALADRWLPFRHPLLDALPDFDAAAALMPDAPELDFIGRALVESPSVAAMSGTTGMGPRRLQRWFSRHVGLPPRRYLRLLRFQKAFEQMPGATSLADHAADQGFADQAHMAREFRLHAGLPANQARRIARGPFLG